MDVPGRILKTLAGRVHELWTGVCLRARRRWFPALLAGTHAGSHEGRWTDVEIDAYLATRRWVGCSGAYAIEEENDPYLAVEEGSWSNVVGLPLESLERALKHWSRSEPENC